MGIWTKWNPVNGPNLHGVQYRILKRGIELLDVGGRIVYSTCSFNPVENEAVISRLLQDAGGCVELVDISTSLPGLKYAPGLTSWVLADKQANIYNSWEDVPQNQQTVVRPNMFPPSSQVVEKLNLNRCIRILPHQQNTGGFFVALLEKKSVCPWEKQAKKTENVPSNTEQENGTEVGNGTSENNEKNGTSEPPKKKIKVPKFFGFREDPYMYLKKDDEIGPELVKYYGLTLPVDLFLTRCRDESKKNNLYFTTQAVKDIVENNKERVKIINTGVKAFSKCEHKGSECDYRIAQEGVLMMLNHISDQRKLYPSKTDMEIMLLNSDFDSPPEINSMTEEFQKCLHKIPTGSVALIYIDKDRFGYDIKVEIVGWKGKNSVRAYVPKNERVHYLRLVGGDVSKFEKNKFEEKKERDAARAQARTQQEDQEGGEKLDEETNKNT